MATITKIPGTGVIAVAYRDPQGRTEELSRVLTEDSTLAQLGYFRQERDIRDGETVIEFWKLSE